MTPASVPVSPPLPGMAKPPVSKDNLKKPAASSRAFWVGLGVSLAWVGTVFAVIAKAGPARDFAGIPLADWAMGVSAAVSPVAMVWMVTAYLQRAADIQTIAEPLRRQLTLITGESGAADARIRRFNQAIREQIELLRSAQNISQDDLESIMERVRTHRAELERFESVSTQQVKDIQDVIRRSMLQVEHMMDDKFTMLRVIDGKLQQNGDGVARQVEGMRDQIARLLEDVEQGSAQMADALDRASRDSKKLSDTSRLQESSLTSAAEAAAETLGGLSSKIDLSVTRFLERASSAREEAERLAGALDAQTRALDDFSSTLPARVSEAEAVLRGVADRLYASEQMAREQAVHLSEKLSQQVDGLQSFMDRFAGRLTDIDTGLDRRHSDLSALAERIGSTTGSFIASWEKSVTDLSDRTGNALLRFTMVNDETRRNAESVAAHLSETTGKYEDVVLRMRALSAQSGSDVKGMTEEITRQLAQFDSLSKASANAGEEVQQRANAALQNLQHVLERMLTAREATQAIGETLVKDIYAAVDQNEKMIARLHDTAQAGARAITAASEQIGYQQGDLAAKTRAGEAALVESAHKLQQQAEAASQTLREQTGNLMNLLAESQTQLAATDQKLQSFAAQAVAPVQKAVQQIDSSAEQGLRSVSQYSEGLAQQVARLQEYHTRIGGMSLEMGTTTAQTVGTFEQLLDRFSAVRATQDESVRQNLAQFSDISDRLQREVVALDGQAARAVEALQDAALKVGEHSYQMLENAQSSGAKMKDVAASLRAEAAQIQTILRQQSEEISGDLARAEQKFSTLGDTIRERADTAYTLIDRTTAHYAAVTQATGEELDARARKIDQTVTVAQARVEQLQAALAREAEQIDTGAANIEMHANEIAATSTRAVQNLSTLNDKISVTHEAASTQAQQTIAKIDASLAAFENQGRTMAAAAESATGSVTKAGTAFGEQAGKLIDSGHQIDAVLRQLTTATGALADQSAQIRVGMEQQNSRLLAQLSDAVAQMDVTGNKLQQITAVASQGADQASTRFTDMAETASQRINATTADLNAAAERTGIALAALGVNIAQQAQSLSTVGEQIGEQQKMLAAANESQRAQMIDLFDKLRDAHTQASDVAERSITHLNNSLQEIYRQIGVIGDKSQEAVGNVKTASIGFSDQANLLLQNAQAAEQQARAVLSVTSALQEQARHLRESLQVESERAGETLGSLLSRLTTGGAEIRDLGTTTGTVLTTLQRALGEQSSELGSSMQQISDRQRSLTAALDAQRETINGLLGRLTLAQDETAAVAERAAVRLTDGAQQINRHVEALDARAQSALLNVAAATTAFAQEAEAIETHARQAEQQSRGIVATAAGLGEQIQSMRTSLQSEGERTNAVLGGLLDKVSGGAAEIRDLGSATEMSLASLGNTVTQQSAGLSSAMQQISDRQRSLTVALDAQRDVVNGLLGRLTLAQDETATSAERAASRLANGAQQIAEFAAMIDTRAQGALSNVTAAATGFATQADAIENHARHAEQQTRVLFETASGLQDRIHDLRQAMQADSERSRETLDDLLGRVTSGSEEIRGAGMLTEATIISMQTSMEEVDARQHKLIASLEQQREAVNGLLNRLTLAQDETAAVAERAASRLTDGAQQISSSAAMIDARAQDALSNVTAAATGFAAHAEAIETHARQAEQQSRSIVDTASNLGEQIQGMRASLQSEGERTNAVLGTLLDKVGNGVAEIRDLGTTAEMSLASLGTTITQQGATLSSVMDQIGDRQRSLAAALDVQNDVANNLVNRLTLAQDETAALAERTAARLTDSAQQITKQIDTIGAQAASTLTQIENSVSGFGDQSSALSLHSQQAEQQMRGLLSVTAGMQDQARHLREAMQVESARVIEQISAVITQLDTTGRTFKNESDTAMQALDAVTHQFTATAHTGTDMVRKQGEMLAQAAEQAEARMVGAGEKMRGHLHLVGEAGDQAETHARRLADSAEFATTRLVTLRDTLAATDKGAVDITDAAHARINDIKQALQGELQRLTDLSQQSVEQVAGASRGLAVQSDALRANLAASESALTEAASLVREEAAHLPAILGRSVAEIEVATRAIKDKTAEADQALIGTADRFIAVTASARNNMVDEMQRVSSVAEDASKILLGFGQMLAEQVSVMQQSTLMLSGEQKELVDKGAANISALAAAGDRLNALRAETTQTAERLLREFDLLDQRATVSGNRLVQAGENVVKQTAAITEATARAENQMSGAGNSFRDQLERIGTGLQSQIDDINRGLMQITAQLERTGSTLRSTTVGAVADVERVGQRFEQTGGEAAAQIDAHARKMQAATDEVGKLLAAFDGQLVSMLSRMADAGDGIKRHEGDALAQLQSMLSHLGVVAEKLEATRQMSGSVSAHAIERLDEVVTAVQTHMNNMTAGAQTAAGVMRGINQIYNDQAQSLAKGVGDAHGQVITMNKSIEDMQQRADRMRASLKLQGEDLMNTLRQILVQLELTGDGLTDAVNRTLQQQAEENLKKIG